MGNLGAIDLSIPVITRRQSIVPVYDTGMTNSVTSSLWLWREGQHLCGDGKISFAAQAAVGETLTISVQNFPGFTSFDINSLPGGALNTNQGTSLVGYSYWFIQGSGWKFLYPAYNTSNSFYFVENTQVLQANEPNTGDAINYYIKVPVTGW